MACRCCASFFMDPSVWKCDYDANGVVNIDKEEFRPHLPGKSDGRGRTSAWSSPTLTTPPQEHILRHVWQEVQACCLTPLNNLLQCYSYKTKSQLKDQLEVLSASSNLIGKANR